MAKQEIKTDLQVYALLKEAGIDFDPQGSDGYVIFHSVQWMKRSNKWKSTWKENDFLIPHRKLGALVLEVKGGDIVYRDGAFNQINQATNEVHILSEKKRNDPLSQAIDGIYHYRRALSNIAYDLDSRFPVEAAVWFSSCEINDKMLIDLTQQTTTSCNRPIYGTATVPTEAHSRRYRK